MLLWSLPPPLAALAATAPDLVPVVQVAPRPSAGALRCSGARVVRTEADGSSTLLARTTIGTLAASETYLMRFPYEVIYCVTSDPRLPWPAGGRFRVAVGSGSAQQITEVSDP